MLRNVIKNLDGSFNAIDETGRKVFITESISFIFEVIVNEELNSVSYRPIDYRRADVLTEVENYLVGKPHNKEVIKHLVIRYGWMDKRLNKLSFLGLTELMSKVNRKGPPNAHRRKLGDLCKQLSLSAKRVIK